MRFELQQAGSIEEAVSLLSKHGEDARVIAGGQSLLLMIRAGLVRPCVLVSLGSLEGLERIETTSEGGVHLGTLTTHRQILQSEVVNERAAVLVQAVGQIGSTPVRNFGTIGGNVCHNEMGSDPPSALLALDAKVECLSIRGRRKMPLDAFLTGYFETCLEPDEILTGIEIPALPQGSRAVYLKHAIRAGDLAIVGVAALLEVRDGFCQEARLVLGGVGPVSFRALEAEKLLRQQPLTDDLIDAHASADYRRKMVRVFVRRAIHEAMREAKR